MKLTGAIQNYRVKRGEESFVFTDADKSTLGVVAIAAGLAGLGGPAIATAGYATNVEEDTDFLEFEIDGRTASGWVWRSPFSEGDVVEVVGIPRGDHIEIVGIARPRAASDCTGTRPKPASSCPKTSIPIRLPPAKRILGRIRSAWIFL